MWHDIMNEVIAEIIGDITMLLIVVILMLYTANRDDKRQDMTEARYDKLIGNLMDNIANQQVYKQELATEIKELSTTLSKISVGMERISNDVNDINSNTKNISSETEKVVSSIQATMDKDKESNKDKEFE